MEYDNLFQVWNITVSPAGEQSQLCDGICWEENVFSSILIKFRIWIIRLNLICWEESVFSSIIIKIEVLHNFKKNYFSPYLDRGEEICQFRCFDFFFWELVVIFDLQESLGNKQQWFVQLSWQVRNLIFLHVQCFLWRSVFWEKKTTYFYMFYNVFFADPLSRWIRRRSTVFLQGRSSLEDLKSVWPILDASCIPGRSSLANALFWEISYWLHLALQAVQVCKI